MTLTSLLGIMGTLGLVLGLFMVTARVLRTYTAGLSPAHRGALRLEIVQRLSIGPKQGIAVVRVGDRLMAVSMGEGGVRPLLELGEAELALLTASEPAPFILPPGTPIPNRHGVRSAAAVLQPDFPPAVMAAVRAAVAGVRRTGRIGLMLFALSAGALSVGAGLSPLGAQTPVQPQAAPVAQPTPTGQPLAAARVDTVLTRLAPSMDLRVGGESDGLRLSGTVGVVIMMGLLTLLPTLVLMMTGFTRILIVLHFLKQAMGTQSAPPAHMVGALALILTGFVMAPTFTEVNRTALEPWLDGRMEQTEMLREGSKPLRAFMLEQTRDTDIESFLELSGSVEPQTEDDIPLVVLTSAFVTSELRTAFQIGFALFLPFIVIDIVVASVLMSMGMFMLPPGMIALPFKLLLFVLVDGWTLVIQGLVQSFE